MGEINNIDHLSPVETETGTELGNKERNCQACEDDFGD